MKLTPALVEKTLDQFNAAALPEGHASGPTLAEVFGDHTFFFNNDGLHIVEEAPLGTKKKLGQIVKIASWANDNHTRLAPHRPEPTNVLVELEAA